MADLSGLKLKKLDTTNWDDYPVGGSVTPPQDPGVFTARAKSFEFKANDGYLQVVMDAEIIDGAEGRNLELRDYLFTKPIQQGRRKGACRAGDYLLSVGTETRPGTDPQEWADAIEGTQDALFQFQLDWNCYDGEKQEEVARTWEDFPPDPTNPEKRLPYVIVKGEDGTERRLTARQRVRYYIAQGRG